ncbi:MAG: cysteine desulfurase family protein [Planctomycetota bacterium]
MRPIYLDYNATTPIAPRVQEAMLPFLAEHYGNPLSEHALGRAAAQAIDDARVRVARAIGAEPDEVYFTTGATESCRLAFSLGRRIGADERKEQVCTTVDHWAVTNLVAPEHRLPVDARGVLVSDRLAESNATDIGLAHVVHANNEIGAAQPVAEAAQSCRQRGALLHTDATQSFGKVAIAVRELGVDLLSFASHKAYGPKGAGALFIRRGLETGPCYGGGAFLTPGTPDVAAIVGFGYAAELAAASAEDAAPRMEMLRDGLLDQLSQGVGDELIVWGEGAQRLPNTLAAAFPGVAGDELLAACPEVCATPLGSGDRDRVRLTQTLEALGQEPEAARGTVRLSVGWYTTETEIDRAASLLLDAWERLRG